MMKKILPLFSLLGILLVSAANAQNPYQARCGTESTQSDAQTPPAPVLSPAGNDSLLTIPIVFHIFHEGGPENISKAQILQALKQLNDDFNR